MTYSNPALEGRTYENTIRSRLKGSFKNIPRSAGFGSGPDLVIPSANTSSERMLVEIKTSTGSDFGQKAVTFNGSTWIPKMTGKEPAGIVELYNKLYSDFNVGSQIASLWKLPNENLTGDDLVKIIEDDSLSSVLYNEKLLVESTGERNPFPTRKIASGKNVVNAIRSYYVSKGVNYIQIKGSGFYILGNDVNNLNTKLGIKIPMFNPSSADLVIRGKPSNSQRTYRPTLTLKSSTVQPSRYNLENRKFIQSLYDNL
jgi:hypothetical protein